MRIITVGLLIGLASGCSTTKQATTTYWTQKAGVVVVHHVVGTIDHTEKLNQKPLSSDEAAAYKLAAKGKYFGVTSHDDLFVPAIKTDVSKPKKDAKKDSDGTKLAEVRSELHDLRNQVSRLKDQIAAHPPTPQQPTPNDQVIAQQSPDPDGPRLSQ